jgi:hypothetical protein
MGWPSRTGPCGPGRLRSATLAHGAATGDVPRLAARAASPAPRAPAGPGRGLYHQAGGPGPGGSGSDPNYPRPGPRGPGPGTLLLCRRAGPRRLRFRPVLLVDATDRPGHGSTRHVTPPSCGERTSPVGLCAACRRGSRDTTTRGGRGEVNFLRSRFPPAAGGHDGRWTGGGRAPAPSLLRAARGPKPYCHQVVIPLGITGAVD